ncbi:hypothetical protein FH968_08020 [Buttiauxella sp. B2]|uniref:hypothetical protein n=1 Tax=Buttiauxella sp. B2 TaxID=2587812 RepID=UPI00111F5914|nr:hypothetical protein [Buttiauxella sp. B2]TNV20859.1 hypothetical protein FH968_08020 [Buttiauxella sp. B2]
MNHTLSLAAVRITLGDLHLYIPATQVQQCVLAEYAPSGSLRLSQWLGLPDEPQRGMHLHLFVPASLVTQGWYFWGELENVELRQSEIFPLPLLMLQCCQLPALRALVKDEGMSPLLSWA